MAMAPRSRTVREEEDVAGTAIVKAVMVPKRLAIISTMPKLFCGRLKDGESQGRSLQVRSRGSRGLSKNCLGGKRGVDKPGPDKAGAMDKLEDFVGG